MTLTVANLPFINRISFGVNKSQLEEDKTVKDSLGNDSSDLYDSMMANYNKFNINSIADTDYEEQIVDNHYDDIEMIMDEYGRDATEDAFEELIENAEDYCFIYSPYYQSESEKQTLSDLKDKMLNCCEKIGTANLFVELSKQNTKDNWLYTPDMEGFNPVTFGEMGERLANLQDNEVMGVAFEMIRTSPHCRKIDNTLPPMEDFVSEIPDGHPNKAKIRDILTNGLDFRKNFDENQVFEPEREKDAAMIEFGYGRKDCKQALKSVIKIARQYCKLNKEENPDIKTREQLEQKMQEYFEKLELANIFQHFIDEDGNRLNRQMKGFNTISYQDIGAELARIRDKEAREDVTRLFAARLFNKSIEDNPVEHIISGIPANKPARNELKTILTDEMSKNKNAKASQDSYKIAIKETIGKEACDKTFQEIIKYGEEYVKLLGIKDPIIKTRRLSLDKKICRNIEKLNTAILCSQIIKGKNNGSTSVLPDFKSISYKDIGSELAKQENIKVVELLAYMFGNLSAAHKLCDSSDDFVEDIDNDNSNKEIIKASFDFGMESYISDMENPLAYFERNAELINTSFQMRMMTYAKEVREALKSPDDTPYTIYDVADTIQEEYGIGPCHEAFNTLVKSSEKACNLIKNSEKSEERNLAYKNLISEMKSSCEKLDMADYYQDIIEDESSELNEIMPDFQTVRLENVGEGLSTVENKKARNLAAWMFGYSVLSKSIYRDPLERFGMFIDDDTIRSEVTKSAKRGMDAYKLKRSNLREKINTGKREKIHPSIKK